MLRFLLASVFGMYAASAMALTINFDTDPIGNPVANGTIVDTLYSSQGVTFSATSTGACGSIPPHIYANNDDPSGFTLSSPPNVVTTCTGSSASDIEESTEGAVRADFTQAATQVCIDVFPDSGTERGFLRAYDATFTLLSTVFSTAGALQNLCVNASGIRRVEFSGDSSTDSFARFDNLVITFAPAAAAAAIPALGPAGLVVLLAALVLIGLWTAHRRKI
jgi:hypothetical protein